MHVLWRYREANARGVHNAVHPRTGWAFSTVQTMLRRLVFKRQLTVHRERQAAHFRPAVS